MDPEPGLRMSVDVTMLPHINAALNGLAALFLLAGFRFIRQGNRRAHQACMISAVSVSALFLACYLVYHSSAPINPFTGSGPLKGLYYAILISHILLAAGLVVLVPVTLYRAVGGRIAPHRKLARWTWPIWLYVSLSGVLVYLFLYGLKEALA